MRAAPPAGRVCRIAPVRRPAVSRIFFQPVKFADILRIADRLKDAHVFSAGENVRAVNVRIDLNDAARDKFVGIELAFGEFRRQGIDKVPPDQRLVGNLRRLSRGNLGKVYHVEMPLQKLFAFFFGFRVIIKYMKRIEIFIFGIDSVACKSAAKAVGALMHQRNGIDDLLSADPFSAS